MISFLCSSCRQPLTIPEANAGQKGKCPHCGTVIDFPQTSVQAEPPQVVSATPAPFVPTASPAPSDSISQRPPLGGSLINATAMELAVNSIILGGIGFVAAGWISGVGAVGKFASVIMALAVLSLGGLGLILAVFAMPKARAQQMRDYWYAMTGLVLSAVTIVCGFTTFIATMIR